MDVVKTTVDEFTTGSGTADATPKSIVAPGYANEAYRGVTVRCNGGSLFVGPHGFSDASGFPLEAGEELFVAVNSPSKVFVVAPAGATYSYIAI